MTTILVTGATGSVGSQVVRELLARGVPVRAFVRNLHRAAALLGDQVELVAGDLADPTSIRTALGGADRVFLCSANHPRQVEHETNVIDAAAVAGVRHLVKVGAISTRIGSPVAFYDAHGRIEAHLWASGVPSTVLSPTMYLSNLLDSAGTISQTGRLFAPAGDAKLALIDPRDVAAVAAVVLTGDGHAGQNYLLTGSEALTHQQVAEQLSRALGRPIEYIDVPDNVAHAGMVSSGVPEWFADQVVALWGEIRRGGASTTTDVVRVLTGRDPRTVADFGREHAAAFSGSATWSNLS